VVCPLKSGKEADLFVVERAPYHYVAKVYKDRKVRSFKNDAGYREGRRVRDSRSQRALGKNTKFGRALAEKAWHMAEVDALRTLEAAGARVPRVLAHHDRVLIMEMICDANGQLAPQLAQVPLSREGAREMFDTILQQVVIMLLNDLVHGDLSPYNILVRQDGPVIIDLPQCVSAAHNQQAKKLLERDVRAVSQYLGLTAPEVRPLGKQAWQLWSEYERGTLTEDFRLDPERKREAEVADLGGLVDFVTAAREEAELEKRAAAGDADARALLKAADRREQKRMRRAAAARAEAAEEARREAQKANRKAAAKAAARKTSGRQGKAEEGGEGPGGGRKRRRRRRRKGGKGGEGASGASAARSAPTAAPKAGGGSPAEGGAPPKKRRRRRRRKKGGGASAGPSS
jgi:RIO kinase 1